MTDHDKQFDGMERHVSRQLRKDLQALFEPPGAVPQQVDKAVLESAEACLRERKHGTPHRLIIPLRWAAAAAAAVIVLGTILYHRSAPLNHQPSIADHQSYAEGRADIDNNGRVDILDAFRLARDIESRAPADAKWDLNGDGRVDRKDVDIVAFAAVRLNKGV